MNRAECLACAGRGGRQVIACRLTNRFSRRAHCAARCGAPLGRAAELQIRYTAAAIVLAHETPLPPSSRFDGAQDMKSDLFACSGNRSICHLIGPKARGRCESGLWQAPGVNPVNTAGRGGHTVVAVPYNQSLKRTRPLCHWLPFDPSTAIGCGSAAGARAA